MVRELDIEFEDQPEHPGPTSGGGEMVRETMDVFLLKNTFFDLKSNLALLYNKGHNF